MKRFLKVLCAALAVSVVTGGGCVGGAVAVLGAARQRLGPTRRPLPLDARVARLPPRIAALG